MGDTGVAGTPLQRLLRAWAMYPPVPDLSSILTPQIVADESTRLEVLRADGLQRIRYREPVRFEDYAALLPDGAAGPGTATAALLILLERLAGASESSLAERLGPSYTGDVEQVFADRTPPTIDVIARGPAPREHPRPAGDAEHQEPDPWAKGDRVGPFTLRRKIGKGGFGEVWLATREHPRLTVAVKVLKRGVTDRGHIIRFEAEAQALAYLDHEYIAKILHAGAARGLPYIAMEYVEGVPLTRYCDDRRLSIDQRLELMARVCEGIQHAHQRGLIHRDLSPDNILVTEITRNRKDLREQDRGLVVDRFDDRVVLPVPKIVDFGLAKAVEKSVRLADGTITIDLGKMMGKPEYMAPEQAQHRPLEVDVRSDVFALGVILYEMLTGVLPLPRERLRQEGVQAIRDTPRPNPYTRFIALDVEQAAGLAAVRGRLDRDRLAKLLRHRVRHLVDKALRLEPRNRFSSAAAFGRDIRNYLQDKNFDQAAAEPWHAIARRHIRRHWLPYGAAAAVVLALVIGIVGLGAGIGRATVAERVARDNEAALERFTTLVLENVVGNYAEVEQTPQMIADGFEKLVERDDLRSPTVRAEMIWRLGQLKLQIGRPAEAIPRLEKAVELLASDEVGAEHKAAFAAADLAEAYMRERRTKDAYQAAERAHDMLERSDATDAEILDAREALAGSLKWLGDLDAARSEYEAVLAARRAAGQDPVAIAGTMYDLALTLDKIEGEKDHAIEVMTQTLEVLDRELGLEGEQTILACAELARMLSGRRDPGSLAEAERLYRTAIPAARSVLGGTHWRTLQYEFNLGAHLVRAGREAKDARRIDEGLEQMRQIHEVYKRAMGPRDSKTLGSGRAVIKWAIELDHPTLALSVAESLRAAAEADPRVEAEHGELLDDIRQLVAPLKSQGSD